MHPDPVGEDSVQQTREAVHQRFFDGFPGFLCWTDDYPGIYPGWSNGRLQLAGDQIRPGWIRCLAFASTLGIGVLFSTVVIFFYQGGISLLAAQAQALITPAMMSEMTAVGGILLLGLAISSLLELKPIRVGNFLPALAIAPLIVAIIAL